MTQSKIKHPQILAKALNSSGTLIYSVKFGFDHASEVYCRRRVAPLSGWARSDATFTFDYGSTTFYAKGNYSISIGVNEGVYYEVDRPRPLLGRYMIHKTAGNLFALCLVLLSTGCSPNLITGAFQDRTIASSDQAQLTNHVEFFPTDPRQTYGTQSGLLMINDEGNNENSVIKGRYYWTFASSSRSSAKFVLVILYDYQQVQFTVNNRIVDSQVIEAKSVGENLKHPFDPGNTEEASHLDFEFTVIPQSGRHMICFLLFADPEKVADVRKPEIQGTQIMNAITIAAIVNQNTTVGQVYSDAPDNEQVVDQDYGLSGGVIINKDPGTFATPWIYETINGNPFLDYYIHLGNATKESYPYLLLAFMNWKQVPPHDDKILFAGILNGLENQTINSTLTLPDKAGVFVVVLVSNPYNHGLEGDTGEWVSFSASNWVLIEKQ